MATLYKLLYMITPNPCGFLHSSDNVAPVRA